MSQTTFSDRELDRLCWVCVSTRDRFHPPAQTAEDCLDGIDQPSESESGFEHGYHVAMHSAYDDMIDQLYCAGINVLDRANRYVHVNRQHGLELRTDDERDFYPPVGDSLPEHDEIESINMEDASYTPRGA